MKTNRLLSLFVALPSFLFGAAYDIVIPQIDSAGTSTVERTVAPTAGPDIAARAWEWGSDRNMKYYDEFTNYTPTLRGDCRNYWGQTMNINKHKHTPIFGNIDELVNIIARHHKFAAEIRFLLRNGGAGPNPSQLERCDVMLREIAGLPAKEKVGP